jgi:hypothetical protein
VIAVGQSPLKTLLSPDIWCMTGLCRSTPQSQGKFDHAVSLLLAASPIETIQVSAKTEPDALTLIPHEAGLQRFPRRINILNIMLPLHPLPLIPASPSSPQAV